MGPPPLALGLVLNQEGSRRSSAQAMVGQHGMVSQQPVGEFPVTFGQVVEQHIVAIVRLLILTGCRFGEIVSLEWDWIKGKRIHLPDSKSGPRTVWLSSAARAVIDAIPRYSPDCPFLFPARPPTRPINDFGYQWERIREEAGLPGLRIHDLRHSWASAAAMNGVDMVTIAKLLGHALIETTERYTHLSDQSVADAADRVSNRIHAALAGRGEHEGGSRHAHR